MEGTSINTQNITQIILDTINNILSSLFSSIDNNIYGTLDDLAFVNTDIIHNNVFEKIFGTNSSSGLLLIANSLIVAFALYYCFKLLYSKFTSIQIENPYQFVFKLVIFGIVVNSSYFICEQIIYINSLISSSICEIGENILHQNISFSALIQKLDSSISIGENNFNLFTFDGLLKGFISVSLLNLLFSYSLRYIMIQVFVLITPFAFLTLINYSTSWFFKAWFKTMFSLLIMQSFVAIILLIIFTLDLDFKNTFSKLLYIGSIYALVRSNSYIQHLIGGISTDISGNVHLMKSLIK